MQHIFKNHIKIKKIVKEGTAKIVNLLFSIFKHCIEMEIVYRLHEVAKSAFRVNDMGMNALSAKCDRSEYTERETTSATNQICGKLHISMFIVP
jgi:hypothetical protein